MKRKPARLPSCPVYRASNPPPSPVGQVSNLTPPADSESLFPEPPPLEIIYAALDEIAKEWGIKL
jgi:hypothetical protein